MGWIKKHIWLNNDASEHERSLLCRQLRSTAGSLDGMISHVRAHGQWRASEFARDCGCYETRVDVSRRAWLVFVAIGKAEVTILHAVRLSVLSRQSSRRIALSEAERRRAELGSTYGVQ